MRGPRALDAPEIGVGSSIVESLLILASLIIEENGRISRPCGLIRLFGQVEYQSKAYP